jgi:uncharacterized membrane protein YoaK (UPF0700 family)
MQLSDTEKKMVARLRKRKQSFARWRWMLLLSSVFSICCGVYCFSILLRFFQLDSASAVSFAVVAPFAYLLIWSGVWIMLDTLVNWHGKPEVDLLLRLVEESQDDA